ncbi:hypothetical protein CJ179_48725 [Rhodococcus sp. ACS1]|uniref:Uncharacterized protein n=1 Tax=Rhodococcus jostii TaxID=132919 RepID=A0A1H4JAG5_RHOJO|nr:MULTISPECIES: hypothetical protein [Rhodococcus]MBC2644824.1 hypothetical protein [Rhodococcus sp. 3A]MBC2890826.1 hypothetical protein [Rhodococcus sp. 4CII]MDJ0418872.1 hypothetical protein [Rhodococcus opacus]PBC35466.1 hypothetical protein CJ179_48725 [Rhodococcus sp. ACS1]SEB43300.1 hypothetical protein SAMN04490220_0757 [Rhodococcus jostii]
MKRAAFWGWATATTVPEALTNALDAAVSTMHQELGADAHPVNTSHTTTILTDQVHQDPGLLKSLLGSSTATVNREDHALVTVLLIGEVW